MKFRRRRLGWKEDWSWKVTESQRFLLYLRDDYLKNVVPLHICSHLLRLSLSTPIPVGNYDGYGINSKSSVLINFVQLHRFLYGLKETSMNLHSLIHLADDARNVIHLTFSVLFHLSFPPPKFNTWQNATYA